MSLTADAVTQILETRYDWYSARAVLRMAAGAAGLDAAGPFDARQVEALADAVLKVGQRAEGPAAGLRDAVRAQGEPAKKPAAEPSPAEAAAETATAEAADGDGDDKKGARKGARK